MRTENLNIGRVGLPAEARSSASPNSFNRMAATLGEWCARAKQRAQLAKLDPVARRDLGLSDADVWREVRKPFWRE